MTTGRRITGGALAAMGAILAMGAGSVPAGVTPDGPAAATQQAQQGTKLSQQRAIQAIKDAAGLFSGMGGWGRNYRAPGPGWTHAQVKRMAKKRRNQIRNRKAHR